MIILDLFGICAMRMSSADGLLLCRNFVLSLNNQKSAIISRINKLANAGKNRCDI